ncbi:MAG TPA: radical SAM protein [Thiotrichales bacterium]|nr:radical SAM protein [Thiotrichales bacterium]
MEEDVKNAAEYPDSGTLRLHARVPRSRANGPGLRAVIWLQGCMLGCRECFNRDTWSRSGGQPVEGEALFRWLQAIEGIEGLSISGGEPTEQIGGLLPLLDRIRSHTSLSILMFSGRTRAAIARLPGGPALLDHLDVLVDGPYRASKRNPWGAWPSSSNQAIHLLSDRYRADDFINLPQAEITITADGTLVETGVGAVMS